MTAAPNPPNSAPLAAAVEVSPTWHERLVDVSVDLAFVILVLGIVLCLVRLLRGPHLADRVLAVDAIAVHVVGFVVLFTLRLDALVLIDGVLVLSLLGFAGTVAMAQYILRRKMHPMNDLQPHRPEAKA